MFEFVYTHMCVCFFMSVCVCSVVNHTRWNWTAGRSEMQEADGKLNHDSVV